MSIATTGWTFFFSFLKERRGFFFLDDFLMNVRLTCVHRYLLWWYDSMLRQARVLSHGLNSGVAFSLSLSLILSHTHAHTHTHTHFSLTHFSTHSLDIFDGFFAFVSHLTSVDGCGWHVLGRVPQCDPHVCRPVHKDQPILPHCCHLLRLCHPSLSLQEALTKVCTLSPPPPTPAKKEIILIIIIIVYVFL
jgi:hypothetical protein